MKKPKYIKSILEDLTAEKNTECLQKTKRISNF